MPDYVVAEFVGRILYGIFTLLIVIVLLNMLIAMITNSFQKIEVSLLSAVIFMCHLTKIQFLHGQINIISFDDSL